MLQFQHTSYIWLFTGLLLLLVLYALLVRWKKKVSKKIGDERLVNLLITNFSSRKFNLKFLLLLLAFTAGVLAVMNLRKPGNTDNNKRNGIDFTLALDISKSMLATDLAPNRLERARQFINKLMDAMPDDRFALVLFAGKAYLQMPMTADHGAARLFVSGADPSIIQQQGTVISDALQKSANAFIATDRKFKAVVLISDGEDHDEGAVSAAKALSKQGVMINTVGIGSVEGSVIVDPSSGEKKKDEAGNTVISKLNETVLKELASVTNGIYVHLKSSDEAVKTIKQQLTQIERKAYADQSLMSFTTYYVWFAAAMFILLLAELFLPERKKTAK